MKAFLKKHTLLLLIPMILVAILSNITTGVLGVLFSSNVTLTYVSEGIVKYMISLFFLLLMAKWGYTKKSDRNRIISGFLAGTPVILFCANNLLPLILVNPIHFKAQWSILLAILFAEFSVGLMEEAGIRGILLPLLCEKWKDKSNVYLRAALVSSLLFGCIHLTWSVRQLLFIGNVPLEFLLGNLWQVFYAFCFGVLMAGIALNTRSILPVVVWHSLADVSAFISRGLLPKSSYDYYYNHNILSLQNVFYEYGIFPDCKYGAMITFGIVNVVLLIIGIGLVKKAKKQFQFHFLANSNNQ